MSELHQFFIVPYLGKPLWIWLVFLMFISFLLIFDLGILQKRHKEMTVKTSLLNSLFYIVIGVAFTGWIWYFMGGQPAKEYLTAYLIEKSLSLDNIFVIALIFTYFKIPLSYQHRVLFFGIVGLLVLRALMIGAGVVLLARFAWMTQVFAVFLVATGLRILFLKEKKEDLSHNLVLTLCRRYLPVTPKLHGNHFFVWLPLEKIKNGIIRHGRKLWVTPLFLVLVLVEFSDIMFAVDSIPAVFSITKDPYIVYTSNIFAVLGLRSLYYSLAAILDRFYYLKASLSLILIFIGGKVFAEEWGSVHVPSGVSLLVTVGILFLGIIFSLIRLQFINTEKKR